MGITRQLAPAVAYSRLHCIAVITTSQRIPLSSRLCSTCRLSHKPSNKVLENIQGRRYYSTKKGTSGPKTGTEIDIARESPYAGLSFGEKVKEVGKDASYTGMIVLSIGVLGTIIYVVFRELFSGDSVNGVYDRALKRCINDTEVSAALGEPIKGYGETTRRGRRRHVSHTEYMVEDQKRLRMQFYVEGTAKKGTVQLEMVKDERGKYTYRFLLVQLNEHPYRTFILEDNR